VPTLLGYSLLLIQNMKPDPKIRSTPRPVRVAYLIEDGPDVHNWLDAIIANCFGRHGGRQSLIVPVENDLISQRYQEWLRVLDPDVVVTLTFNNDALIPGLVELLADTAIIQRKRKRDAPEEHPRLEIEEPGLTSLSWLPFLKARSSTFQTAPEFILDCYPAWEDDGFIKDNFGTLCGSSERYPVHEEINMRAIMLTPKDAPSDRWRFNCHNAEEIIDGYEIVKRMSTDGGITTLAHLSNLNCQPHRIDHPWNRNFCVVIGDSFTDRVACWNAGLLFGDATNQTYKTLRIPAAICSNEEQTAKIGHFLQRLNWVGQENGSTTIAVRSSTLSEEDVQKFMTGLQAASKSAVRFEVITSTDNCCPLEVQREHGAFNIGISNPIVSESTIRDGVTVVNIPKPIQLSYCAGLHPIFSRGSWLIDVEIDRLQDNSRFDNVRETWRLPNRHQLASMFLGKFDARILRNKKISVWVNVEAPDIDIKQPDDDEVFYSILCRQAQFRYGDMRATNVKPIAYKHSKISDKGRYLQGVLGLFGSLNNLEHTLSNHFWRTQFISMAAPAKDQHADVIVFLQRRLKAKNGTLNISDDAGWQNLAERVIQKSNKLKIPRLKTCYEKLLKAWRLELSAAIEIDPHLKDRQEQFVSEAPDDLKHALSVLFNYGVFYRGHEWSCRHCSHRNWVGIEALRESMPCEVCRYEHQLPVDLGLDFRLNEFFATCLREHDTMSVAWALCALREKSKDCFVFAPQTELFRNYPEEQGGKADRELDLLCIADGKFVLGEVKNTVELIATSDIRDLATAATELGADVALLAALSGDRRVMDRKLEELRLLLPETIEVKGMLSDWNDQPSRYI